MAETTNRRVVSPQSDNRGTKLEDYDEGGGQETADLKAGEQCGAPGGDRGADTDGNQAEYESECNQAAAG